MIIITGACGFIGSNLIKALNEQGINEIIAVDDLTNGQKIHNISSLEIKDYLDKDDFLDLIEQEDQINFKVKAIIHMGACSKTTEWNGKYIMKNNYEYSKKLLNYCNKNESQFIYASSASVYGNGSKGFIESKDCEGVINAYAYSKLQFDRFVREYRKSLISQVVGLRFFNVYGPNEQHKENMASVIYHFNNQFKKYGKLKLFKGSHGYADGEQMRDFIFVKDCVNVVIWFLKNIDKNGIFNVGTGISNTFNTVAKSVIKFHGKDIKNPEEFIEYVNFPEKLVNAYQSFTKADLTNLRSIGYKKDFTDINTGIEKYLTEINQVEN